MQTPRVSHQVLDPESQIIDLNLPSIATLIQNTTSNRCWKRCIKDLLRTRAHLHLLNQAEVKSNLEFLTMCDPNFSTLLPLEHETLCH